MNYETGSHVHWSVDLNLHPKTPTGTSRAPSSKLLAVLLLVLACSACSAGMASPALEKQQEADRILEVMELQPGESVADVGAGDGDWAVPIARSIGPQGTLYATEVSQELLDEMEQRFATEDLDNVTFVLGDDQSTGLPAECCDAALLRKVYHHFTNPQAMAASLFAALRPNGRLVIVEYSDHSSNRLEGVPENRIGHSLAPELLIDELTAAGFEVVETLPSWMDNDNQYCVIFRRPATAE